MIFVWEGGKLKIFTGENFPFSRKLCYTGETAVIGQLGANNGTFSENRRFSRGSVIGTLFQGATAGAGCRLPCLKVPPPVSGAG